MKPGAAARFTMRPTCVDPVNETTWTAGCGGQGRADLVAIAGDEVDDARRKAGVLEHLDEVDRRERRLEAGLNTTVLPQTSAGMIFHDGMAIGKFHGVIIEHTPSGWRTDIANLLRSSEGAVWPNMPAALTRHVEGHVDGFLHVAAGFLQHFAHLAGHVPREGLLPIGDELRRLEQQLGAARRRYQAPGLVAPRGGAQGGLDVHSGGMLETDRSGRRVRRVPILESLPGA